MRFRKNSLLFIQSEILYIVMGIFCVPLIFMLGLALSLLYMFPFMVMILVNSKLYNEFVEIDETGISCQKSGKQLWSYRWESIAELKKTSRFLMPSIEILTYNKHGESERFSHTNHYFQLGGVAKEAIERYAKGQVKKTGDGLREPF